MNGFLYKLKMGFKCFYLNSIASSPIWSTRMRRLLLRLYGHKVSDMKSKCFIGEGSGHIIMGNGSFCNVKCLFDCANDIIIGNNCRIAYGVTFVNSTHVVGTPKQRAGGGKNASIIVEDGVWIGANSTIMPGVTIAKGCIIAAGAIVNKSTEVNGLYGGVPAIRIKDL